MIAKPPECYEDNHNWNLKVKGLPLAQVIQRDDMEVIDETFCNVFNCRTCFLVRIFLVPSYNE